MERNMPLGMCACICSVYQISSWQNCGCTRESGVRPSCRQICLTLVLDHSDITGHAEPWCFGQETASGELWAGCYLYTFLSVFLQYTAIFLSWSILSIEVAISFLGGHWTCHRVRLCSTRKSHQRGYQQCALQPHPFCLQGWLLKSWWTARGIHLPLASDIVN